MNCLLGGAVYYYLPILILGTTLPLIPSVFIYELVMLA
jgi:hypothetical protein